MVKARPDAHIRNWEGTLWQQGISPADRKVWKDKRVGDAVFYSPRDVFDEHIEQNDLNTDVTVSNDIQNALLDQLMLSPIRLYIEQQGATEKQ